MEKVGGKGQLCVVHVGAHASRAPPQKSPVPSVKGTCKSQGGTNLNLHQGLSGTFNFYFNFLHRLTDFSLLRPRGGTSALHAGESLV